MKLPSKIYSGWHLETPIIQCKLPGGKIGKYDSEKNEILIEESLLDIKKNAILFHEILHIAFDTLLSQGILKEHPHEEVVENLSGYLFLTLASSGLWSGIEQSEIEEYLTGIQDDSKTTR